jgi:hypothetical protein
MSAEPGLCKVAAERTHLSALMLGAMLFWDGMGAVSRDIGSYTDAAPDPHDAPGAHSMPNIYLDSLNLLASIGVL